MQNKNSEILMFTRKSLIFYSLPVSQWPLTQHVKLHKNKIGHFRD